MVSPSELAEARRGSPAGLCFSEVAADLRAEAEQGLGGPCPVDIDLEARAESKEEVRRWKEEHGRDGHQRDRISRSAYRWPQPGEGNQQSSNDRAVEHIGSSRR